MCVCVFVCVCVVDKPTIFELAIFDSHHKSFCLCEDDTPEAYMKGLLLVV